MLKKNSKTIKPVSQEHPLGCSVACVASLCGISYRKALRLFDIPDHAWIRGYYCSEVVKALKNAKFNYKFAEVPDKVEAPHLYRQGTIVFVSPGSKYPSGHFLLRVNNGWMNPWSNFPQMIPIKSTIEQKLPGPVSYVIYPHSI